MDDEDQIVVLTIRCIDMAPSSDDVKKAPCSTCGEMTWLSSSWKGKKIDKIICSECFYKSKEYKNGDYSASVTEECLEGAKDWVRRNLNLENLTDKEIKAGIVEVMEGEIRKEIKIIEKGNKLSG